LQSLGKPTSQKIDLGGVGGMMGPFRLLAMN
jgi:hypothetical protein